MSANQSTPLTSPTSQRRQRIQRIATPHPASSSHHHHRQDNTPHPEQEDAPRRLSPIPSIGTISSADREAVEGYAHLMLSMARDAGWPAATDNATITTLRDHARQWLRMADEPEADPSAILGWHDMVHRLANRQPSPAETLNRLRRRALRRLAGSASPDKAADALPIMYSIRASIGHRAIDADQIRWYVATLDRWTREALSYRPLAAYPAATAASLAAFLLTSPTLAPEHRRRLIPLLGDHPRAETFIV